MAPLALDLKERQFDGVRVTTTAFTLRANASGQSVHTSRSIMMVQTLSQM